MVERGPRSSWQLGDRLVAPFVLLTVVAFVALAWLVRDQVSASQVVTWVLACALVGLCYGALQNLTMLQAFAAAGPRRVGTASAIWNAGFDAGTATGSLVVGWVAVGSGFGPGMALTAVLSFLTLPLALVRARR